MRSAVLFPAIILAVFITLSLYGEESVDKNKTSGEKAVSIDEKTSPDSPSKDIRDTDIRDSKDRKPQKKNGKTADAGAEKKTGKKPAKKSGTAEKKTTKKTDTRKKAEAKPAKKSEKKSQGQKGMDKPEGQLLSLRDAVINNRIFDVRAMLEDPERRPIYDLDKVIILEDGRKATLLNDAVLLNFSDMVDILLAAGADINSVNPDTGAALHVASSANNTVMIRHLLEKGADVNVRDGRGNTPLLAALHSGYFESANLLVMKGADTASVNNDGSTTIIEAVTGGNMDCIRLILAQNRQDINKADGRGRTPLYLAMQKNDTVLMRLLRDNGASDRRVTVSDVTFGEIIEGTYLVKEYGRVTSDTRRSADDTTAPFRYIFMRDGTGTVDMDDPAVADMKFRWHVDGNALILEELDARGYVTRKLRFMFLQTAGTVFFEKSDVQYGDVSGKRLEIIRAGR